MGGVAGDRFVATLGYQGSAGHKQIRIVNQNFLYQNNPAFYAVYAAMPDVNTNFNALLVTVSRRYTNGVQFATNYRFSKSIDTLSYEGPGFVTNQTYPQQQSTERGPSDFDSKHYWNASIMYDLPVYKKQDGVLGKVLGGFSISTVLTYHTGFPWTPVTGQSVSTPGGPSLSPTRPVAYFGGAGTDTSNNAFLNLTNFAGGGAKYFDITHGGFPGIGRNSFRGPNFMGNDVSLMKQTKLPFGELTKLELRINLYNALNKLNLQLKQAKPAATRLLYGPDPRGERQLRGFGRRAIRACGRVAGAVQLLGRHRIASHWWRWSADTATDSDTAAAGRSLRDGSRAAVDARRRRLSGGPVSPGLPLLPGADRPSHGPGVRPRARGWVARSGGQPPRRQHRGHGLRAHRARDWRGSRVDGARPRR